MCRRKHIPSIGQGVQYFSTTTILANYDERKIVRGVELGATPDIEVPYYQFHDINALESAITE